MHFLLLAIFSSPLDVTETEWDINQHLKAKETLCATCRALSARPLSPPLPPPYPRGGTLHRRPRKSLGQPRPPRRNPRGCPRLTCGANSLTLTFMSALALPCACCSSRPPPHPLTVRDVCALRSRLPRCLLGRARLHAPRDRIGRAHSDMREHVGSTRASAVLSACMCPEVRL